MDYFQNFQPAPRPFHIRVPPGLKQGQGRANEKKKTRHYDAFEQRSKRHNEISMYTRK